MNYNILKRHKQPCSHIPSTMPYASPSPNTATFSVIHLSKHISEKWALSMNIDHTVSKKRKAIRRYQ